MVSSKFHILSHCQDQHFFLNNNNNKKEQLKNPEHSWQIPFKDKKSRTRQHWDVIYVLPPMSIRVHCCSLLREHQCNLCLLRDRAYGWGGGAIPFFHCVHQNKIRSARKKCLESAKGTSSHWAAPAFSCSWLLMSTYEGEETSSPPPPVKLPWRKKKNLHSMFRIFPVQWGVLENFRKTSVFISHQGLGRVETGTSPNWFGKLQK